MSKVGNEKLLNEVLENEELPQLVCDLWNV